jgi:hypothetical protein
MKYRSTDKSFVLSLIDSPIKLEEQITDAIKFMSIFLKLTIESITNLVHLYLSEDRISNICSLYKILMHFSVILGDAGITP